MHGSPQMQQLVLKAPLPTVFLKLPLGSPSPAQQWNKLNCAQLHVEMLQRNMIWCESVQQLQRYRFYKKQVALLPGVPFRCPFSVRHLPEFWINMTCAHLRMMFQLNFGWCGSAQQVHKHEFHNVQKNGWTDRCTDRQIDGHMHNPTDRQWLNHSPTSRFLWNWRGIILYFYCHISDDTMPSV